MDAYQAGQQAAFEKLGMRLPKSLRLKSLWKKGKGIKKSKAADRVIESVKFKQGRR